MYAQDRKLSTLMDGVIGACNPMLGPGGHVFYQQGMAGQQLSELHQLELLAFWEDKPSMCAVPVPGPGGPCVLPAERVGAAAIGGAAAGAGVRQDGAHGQAAAQAARRGPQGTHCLPTICNVRIEVPLQAPISDPFAILPSVVQELVGGKIICASGPAFQPV